MYALNVWLFSALKCEEAERVVDSIPPGNKCSAAQPFAE